MDYRNYDPARDADAAHRIWREVGWIGTSDAAARQMDTKIAAGRALVAELNGEPECLVHTAPGTIQYLGETLPYMCIAGVTTSRVARRQGLARRLTAAALAMGAADGAAVAGLGMFEQGYYNRLGFGTGSYETRVSFDPAHLTVDVEFPVPRRLTSDDWALIHAARLNRPRIHGSCTLDAPQNTRAEIMLTDNEFGLGYCGDDGQLTHHFWCRPESVSSGPYNIKWMTFHTGEQFLQLMALLRSFREQVKLVSMVEPPGIQLVDFVRHPNHSSLTREGSRYQPKIVTVPWWQMRICDLPACMEKTHLAAGEVRLNLELTDPIERFLDDGAPWRGLTGSYIVTLGPSSSAKVGTDSSLPTLKASVNAFTRMWLGVRPASGLAISDDLSGPAELLERLDVLLRLPVPNPDWHF